MRIAADRSLNKQINYGKLSYVHNFIIIQNVFSM